MHEGDNLDETSQKIIDAAMTLVRDKGYVATTTKEIAKVAGVNECTLFRKFKSKKDIVLQGVNQAGGERMSLQKFLKMFNGTYRQT